jgi:2-polyprenyl-3-methyl-5-hydroxy-6-metoxy-1,4-benzoquinol methylase
VRREIVSSSLSDRSGVRVLDFECGTGSLTEYLPGTTYYTGVDLSPSYIRSARRRYDGRGRFFVGRLEDLDPDELGEFDVVIAKGLLHHLDEEEALHVFTVASGMLTEGGRLFTADPACIPHMSRGHGTS